LFLLRPVLGKAPFGNDHLVIVGQRPEAVVEEPVRILAQGQTIPRIVVARVRNWWMWAASTMLPLAMVVSR